MIELLLFLILLVLLSIQSYLTKLYKMIVPNTEASAIILSAQLLREIQGAEDAIPDTDRDKIIKRFRQFSTRLN